MSGRLVFELVLVAIVLVQNFKYLYAGALSIRDAIRNLK
jgi:hypothetical protein